jgi:hypothetical protein
MYLILTITLLALMVSMSFAACPNGCSGHGSCDSSDKCTCYLGTDGLPAWTFADCSGRTCPHATAWFGYMNHTNDIHPSMECSNRGTCDRATGECVCALDTEGIACERSRCPNDCSGAGICYNAEQLASEQSRMYAGAWDSKKTRGCICDTGRRGVDCSLIECPSGADPMNGPGNEAGRDCSGRGLCDYTTGHCQCMKGYWGEDCRMQHARW